MPSHVLRCRFVRSSCFSARDSLRAYHDLLVHASECRAGAHVVCSGFKVAADGAFFSCIRLVGGASFAVLGGSDHVTFVVCCYRTTIDQVSILMLDGDLCSVHPSDLLLDLVPEDPRCV